MEAGPVGARPDAWDREPVSVPDAVMTPEAMPSFVAIGELMVDVAATGRGHEARITVSPGGSAANAAVWASALGAQTAVVGRVGADQPGRMVRSALLERGVAALVTEDADLPTGTFLTIEGAEGARVLADFGANGRFGPDDLPGSLTADAVLVSGYLLLHDSSQAGARAAIERAEAGLVAVDAASRALLEACGRERFLALAAGATALLAGEEEASLVSGQTGAEAAASALGERFRLVAVTRGPAGAVAVLDGESTTAAPAAAEAGAGTGAGDAFAAGLLVALGRGLPLQEALGQGCSAGAAAVRRRWPPSEMLN